MSICEGSWPTIIATHAGSYSTAKSILIMERTSSNDAHTVGARRQRSCDDAVSVDPGTVTISCEN